MTGRILTFPGTDEPKIEEQVSLSDWFNTIVNRVADEPLEHTLVIVTSQSGEQVVYSMNNIRKDQYVGLLQLATLQGIYDGVAQ